MNNRDYLEQLIRPYGPRLSTTDLVRGLNLIYHQMEAPGYDQSHPEIHEQLPGPWRRMTTIALSRLPDEALRILDYGCGTGFEAAQLLSLIPPERIALLTCFDPSESMLQQCRERLGGFPHHVRFCTSKQAVVAGAPYHVLATNSLLHHLADPVGTVNALRSSLSPESVWLAGHEPSVRFYENPECVALLQRFERGRRLRVLLSPGRLSRTLIAKMGLGCSPEARTARESKQCGMFRRRPPAFVIDRVVDCHVPHSRHEAKLGRGFRVGALERAFASSFRLLWSRSYNFLGPHCEARLSERWLARTARLQARYPSDGANICMAWSSR